MRRFVKRISLPLMLLVGLTMIGPQTAEAARWRRIARRATVHVAPPVVYVAPVRVYAPAVGVHVHAPGVGVHVGPRYPLYYGHSYYLRW